MKLHAAPAFLLLALMPVLARSCDCGAAASFVNGDCDTQCVNERDSHTSGNVHCGGSKVCFLLLFVEMVCADLRLM